MSKKSKRVVAAMVGLLLMSAVAKPERVRAQDSLMVVLAGGERLEMVWVKGGTFTMGSNEGSGVSHLYESARPEHRVSVGGFYMATCEVTQALWKAVMGENPSKFVGDSLPVEQVSWVEAQQFVTLLSQMTGLRFRLPSEAEWEYAARGGVYSSGKPLAGCDRKSLGAYAWFCANSDGHTHTVGRMRPNELGLYDMSGNVAEWCADWMADYTAEPQSSPRGPRTGESRILRGGHYNSTSSACAVFDRGWYVPDGKTEYYGLRIVMDRVEE